MTGTGDVAVAESLAVDAMAAGGRILADAEATGVRPNAPPAQRSRHTLPVPTRQRTA